MRDARPGLFIRIPRVVVAAAMLVGVGASACSDANQAAPTATSQVPPNPATTATTTSPLDPADPATEPPTSTAETLPPLPDDLPPPTGNPADAVDEIAALLPLTDDELTCLVDAVENDAELHAALEADPTKEGPAGRRALQHAQDCVIYFTTSQNFVDEAGRHTPEPLTADQRDCLAAGFRALDKEQLAELMNLAINPTAISPETQTAFDGIYTQCDVTATQ